jgi:ribosomal subunit interface protein
MNDRAANVQLTVRGDVPGSGADYALDKIRRVVGRTSDRISSIHVVLTVVANPAHEAPASVDAEVHVAGCPVHVHATGVALTEAVDGAADRLRRQLTDRRERPRSRRRTARPTPPAVEEHDVQEEQDHE